MLTPDQIEAMEEQNEIAAVLEWEEEMQAKKIFVPWMPEDGEETDAQEEIE